MPQPSQVLAELLRGKGAHVDPIASVEDLSSELAERRIEGFPHSVADLVFHMNYWMNYELKRIRGQNPHYPEHNAESFPSARQNWDQLNATCRGSYPNFPSWRNHRPKNSSVRSNRAAPLSSSNPAS